MPRGGRAGHGKPERGAAEAGASPVESTTVPAQSMWWKRLKRTPWLKGPHSDRGHEEAEGRNTRSLRCFNLRSQCDHSPTPSLTCLPHFMPSLREWRPANLGGCLPKGCPECKRVPQRHVSDTSPFHTEHNTESQERGRRDG